jgi:peptidoglycan/LPS O-acetylase OafA/YrhL
MTVPSQSPSVHLQAPVTATAVNTSFHYGHAGRSLPMDMLRGVAILLVLGRHYVVAPRDLGAMQAIAGGWTSIGWAGVDLFFVLSGFLVSGLIFAEYRQRQCVDIRRFVIRRGFKIWPPYLVYIGVVAVWLALPFERGSAQGVWTQLWPNVVHVQNYFHTPRVHTWSLAVEEHFYLAAAVAFFWLFGRRNPTALLRHLPTFISGCVVGLALVRHVTFLAEGPERMNLYATHLRFDGLLMGTLLAYWTHFAPAKLVPLTRRPVTCMIGGAMLAAPTLVLSPEASPWSAGVGLTAVYVGFGLIMIGWLHVATVHPSWNKMFGSRAAAILGQIGFFSYSIYLWHVDLAQIPIKKAVQWAAMRTTNFPPEVMWIVATTLYVVAAVVVGTVLARLLEIPSLALRDRLFPSAIKVMGTSVSTQTTPPSNVARSEPPHDDRAVTTRAVVTQVGTV